MLVRNDEEYIIKNDSVVTLQGKRNKKLKANNLYLIGNGADGPYIKSIKYITCIYLMLLTATESCKSVKVKAFILNDIFYSSQSILSLIVIINKLQPKEKKNFLLLVFCLHPKLDKLKCNRIHLRLMLCNLNLKFFFSNISFLFVLFSIEFTLCKFEGFQ